MRFNTIFKSVATATLAAAMLVAPAAFAADAKKEAKAKPYPLDTCLVTGEKLGGMGDPYVFVHKGQEIKLCCKGCLKSFEKDTAKYLKKIDAAAKPAK